MYSTIRVKKGQCIDCLENGDTTEKYLTAKRCQMHYKQFRAKLAKPTVKQVQKEENREELDRWFRQKRVEMTGTCANCGQPSNKYSTVWWKHSVAHILPKSLFLSVCTHPHAAIELCNTCHTVFDRSVEDASRMPVFRIAVEKFRKFEKQIKEKHKHLDLFVSYAKQLGYYPESN